MKAEDRGKILDKTRENNRLLEDAQASNSIRLIAGYCDTHNCGACAIERYCEALEFHNEMPIMHLIEEIEDE